MLLLTIYLMLIGTELWEVGYFPIDETLRIVIKEIVKTFKVVK